MKSSHFYRRFSRVTESPLGFPVPADARYASAARMRELTEAARRKGFSRKGPGNDESCAPGFIVVPYHPESSPEACWMCFVFALPPEGADPGIPGRALGGPYRLDIAVRDFYSLAKAGRKTRDLFLARLVWKAASRAKD
ncbi:hypothetical protein ACWCPE_24805 [Streptomyces nondiastaticus]